MNTQHQPRKRFGQNFLIDQQVIGQIVAAINPTPEDNLIEIGPGMAAITEHLVKLCPSMTLVELDRDLVEFLQQKELLALQDDKPILETFGDVKLMS